MGSGRLGGVVVACILAVSATAWASPGTEPDPGTVALTFDDGPHPTWTPVVLDVLDRYGVKATFFVQGWRVDRYPELTAEIAARGHSVQSHAYGHSRLTGLSSAAVRRELQRTTDAIVAAVGVAPTCLRPPYGATSDRVRGIATAQGLETVIWDVNSADYSTRSARSVVTTVTRRTEPGDLVLGHDTLGWIWRDALPTIIETFLERGYGFDTICQEGVGATLAAGGADFGCVDPELTAGIPGSGWSLVDPMTGVWCQRSRSGAIDRFYYGDPGDTPFMGDWDCDGVDTPGLYRRSDGYVYLRNSNTQGIADVRFYFGDPGDLPLAGDFDGDGCDTVSVYRPSTARFYLHNRLGGEDAGLGAAEIEFAFGDVGDVPIAGDFDGDGTDGIGVIRGGVVYLRNEPTAGPADAEFAFGARGDLLAVGDWQGTGVETLAAFSPTERTLAFRFAHGAGPPDAGGRMGDRDWVFVPGRFA